MGEGIGVVSRATANDRPCVSQFLYTCWATRTGVWHTIDPSREPWNVPKDAKLALLSGILLITHGMKAEPANLALYLRSPGDERLECETPFIVGQATVDTAGSQQVAFAAARGKYL
jgi:hypothetical protein